VNKSELCLAAGTGFMEQDFEELKTKMEDKVKESFELAAFFHHNLNNFAHRYFEKPSSSLEKDEKTFIVEGSDSKLKDYLKSDIEKVKIGSTNLAKTVPYKEGPKLKLSLGVKVIKFDPTRGGIVEVFSRIHWGFPLYEENASEFFEKKVELKFEDIILLRNKLAKSLESACEIFP
jgi:hypothetical protein